MASQSLLDEFNRLKVQIGLELEVRDVKVLKSLVVQKIEKHILDKINLNEPDPGLELLNRLQLSGFLSENNLLWLKETLKSARRIDLIKKVDEFEKKVEKLKDVPQSLVMANLPASHYAFLQLLLSGPSSSIAVQRIDELREVICTKLGIKLDDVPYTRMVEANNQESTFVTFQFPLLENKVDQLNLAASNKAEWLLHLGVLQLKIDGKATINIHENLQEIRPARPRQTMVLETRPEFCSRRNNVLDLILVIEVSFSVPINVLKQLLMKCQSEIRGITQQGLDMRLAVVTYGNHCKDEPTQLTAFLAQEFSYDFDYTTIKSKGQRGGEGCSGIADAMSKVVELKTRQEFRQEATTLCILINFLVQESTDLEYYRCSHGIDAIELCTALANNGILLDIFGVNARPSQGANRSNIEKNYFLEGIAYIGGGRYFQLEKVDHLEQAITSVIRHEMSIENQGGVCGGIIKDEINNNHGVININGLPRNLEKRLNERSCTVHAINENGKNVKTVSPLAKRVSWADNLDDAKRSVNSMKTCVKSSGKPKDECQTRACVAQSCHGPEDGAEVSATSTGHPRLGKDSRGAAKPKPIICLVENEPVDYEVAVRITRRHVHRMAYFLRSVPEEQPGQNEDDMEIE